VSGGEAFNIYFNQSQRIITSDIDTKFVPVLKGFENLQAIKLYMWNLLGQHAKRLDTIIKNRIRAQLCSSRVGRLLGISVNSKGPWVTRRYTLIPKKRHSLTKTNVSPENVLIDVELFALDLRLNYFSPLKKRVIRTNLGGILDIAMMRPGEIGYEVEIGRNQGVQYTNRRTGKIKMDRRILFASRRFLVNDLYLMQRLGLRPKKIAKDRLRMFQFAKDVLNVKSISKSDTIVKIFEKSQAKLGPPPRHDPKLSKRPKFVAGTYNPKMYTQWTTRPNPQKLYQLVGSVFKLPKFTQTSGPYRFNINSDKWVPNNRQNYIKNEYPFRPKAESIKKLPRGIRLLNTLYGYRANRNGDKNVIRQSALIPLIGLKNLGHVRVK